MANAAAEQKIDQKKKDSTNPLISIAKRNREMEKRTHSLLRSQALLAIALIVSVGGNVLQGTRKTERIYFVQNEDGSGLKQVTPIDSPVASKAAVGQLVVDALTKLNALDFANYKNQLSDVAPYFTTTGWGRYQREFVESGTRDVIEKRQLVLSGAVTKPPVITGEGKLYVGGPAYWDVEVPYVIRYQGGGYDQQQSGIATVKVVRVIESERPKGLAIAEFKLRAG
jgi:hypothetical protein